MDNPLAAQTDFIFYSTGDKHLPISVRVADENIWASQAEIAEIFEVTKSTISRHLKNIFSEGELEEKTSVAKIATDVDEQRIFNVSYYNLDAIIAVGYRVNSYRAIKFRIWATQVLKEYMIKGFALDDERLKQGKVLFNKDYFDELLERIREIRASEARFYDKVKKLFATSYDYDPGAPIAKNFFADVQNKLEYAVTGQTAAEIIQSRANHQELNMGLTTWKNQKQGGTIRAQDVTTAKNYLTKVEVSELNLLVNMFLDYAENQAKRNVALSMKDWQTKLGNFLQFNEYQVLEGFGKVKKMVADEIAKSELQKYQPIKQVNPAEEVETVYEQITTKNQNKKVNPNTNEFDKKLKKALNYILN